MNRFLIMILSLGLLLSACAGRIEEAPGPPVKVDLAEIVETGVVQPVGGFTPAGQPDEAALSVFAKNGYAAVIDLRTSGEERGIDEQTVVEGLGMDYVSLPVGRDGITFENARALDQLIRSYERPVLVHCGSSNRVGALLALRASLNGVDDETAIEVGKKGGLTGLEPTVRDVLGHD